MWIVRLALRRPLSVAVFAILLLVLGVVSFLRMNVDIFPAIDLPVVIVVWNYPGLSATDMERRVVLISERAFSTTVNGIEHIESTALNGVGLIKVYFHAGSDVAGAIAQIASVSQTILKIVPPGMQAPNVIEYNAANVPVAQLNVHSDFLPEQDLFDYGLNFIRVRLFTIEGLASPAPFGGVQRQVMVNLRPNELYAQGLSPADVADALNAGNVILPAGTMRVGNREYVVALNGSPQTIEGLNEIPVKPSTPTPVLMRDVAPVTDTHAVQTNVVRVDGRRATYLAVLKHAAASTLRVVDQVKATIPLIKETAPPGLDLDLGFDQSVFVRSALWGVVREAAIAAGLVALMVLLFLGSARSTLIVVASIPLAILGAVIGLALSGQTINIMSLGGLALAVGMLVDDATVEIENIHRNHAMGRPLVEAILAGAHQIATPTLVGTLSICIVFAPIMLLQGVSKYLFVPLALAVVYAMLLSYLLSRTLVPSMAHRLLAEEPETHGEGRLGRITQAFDARFERFRDGYRDALGRVMARRGLALGVIAAIVLASGLLLLVVGQDFFPTVDAGMMRLHLRAPTGTRIEETERQVDAVEQAMREIIPPDELASISDNIGLPTSYNLAFYQTDSVGPQDADVLVALKPDHAPTMDYVDAIRARVATDFPQMQVYAQAADIVGQVLNFGLSAPIDVQISGLDLAQSNAIAQKLRDGMRQIPGTRDVRIAQLLDYPTLRVDVDRSKALQLGVTEGAIASSVLTSLSSSFLTTPSFWLDPRNNVNYTVAVQTPFKNVDSIQALERTPLHASVAATYGVTPAVATAGGGSHSQLLANVASVRQDVQPAVINHYTVQRVIDVDCGVRGRDLGSVTADVRKLVDDLGQLPPGTRIAIRGQSQAMAESFASLGGGIALAIVLVYLLMVANFQSWLEPFVIMLAVPGALAGVLWMLWATGTTLNVESLMGTVMAVGVAVANGNLLITFANELREEGYEPMQAAIEAARIRLRPVIMTALAMVLGMLPMALALGEGGEQNAPLGRAVIGGLLAATATTLFVVPTVYAMAGRSYVPHAERDAAIADAAKRVDEPAQRA
jgi:multidrug efflux pump subunit AcrB